MKRFGECGFNETLVRSIILYSIYLLLHNKGMHSNVVQSYSERNISRYVCVLKDINYGNVRAIDHPEMSFTTVYL